MKSTMSLVIVILAAISGFAQAKPTNAADYKGTFQYAVSATNEAFPFVFTVVTVTYENGKIASAETDIDERQAMGVERETKTLIKDGKTLTSYSIMVGFGSNTYCSMDGVSWRGPQQYVCPGPDGSGLVRLYGPRKPETAEYTVEEKSVNGKKVKVYREYLIFSSSNPSGKNDFQEKIATIDSRGFFISIVGNEGTLDPKTVTLVRKQTWDFNTKIKPIVAPK